MLWFSMNTYKDLSYKKMNTPEDNTVLVKIIQAEK